MIIILKQQFFGKDTLFFKFSVCTKKKKIEKGKISKVNDKVPLLWFWFGLVKVF
jgi:hypothetical protein